MWSVIDVETTGLYPRTDRIVEIAVVTLSPDGREVSSWTTLLDPDRDIGASHIHGLYSRHLRGAPRFADVAEHVLHLVSGTAIASHNSRFEAAFLSAECQRAGIRWNGGEGLCTMTVSTALGLVSSRSLAAACEELGIALEDHHTALADARAAAILLTHLLPPRGYVVPEHTPAWPPPAMPAPQRLRTDPPLPRSHGLGSLASRVGIPKDQADLPGASQAYLAVLDRVLEDRHITQAEVDVLAALARDWEIGVGEAAALHQHYFAEARLLAEADGRITDAERWDLEALAELLGVTDTTASPPIPSTPVGVHGDTLRGMSVCFTGESVCTLAGAPLTRNDQERLAVEAGLVVRSGVSNKLDVLVLADPDSRSGKARRAAELGIRRIAEPVFWRRLGVPID